MRSIRTVVIVIVVLVVAIGLFLAKRSFDGFVDHKLFMLFSGPVRVMQTGEPAYRSECTYDAEAYKRYASASPHETPDLVSPPPVSSDWMEMSAVEESESPMRRSPDAVTGATAVVRLHSPTVHRDRMPSQSLRISYPPDGAVFPPNLCPPCVEWEDPRNDFWQVEVGVEETSLTQKFLTREQRWQFPSEVWERIQKEAVQKDAWIQVKGVRREQAGAGVDVSQKVRFRISQWPTDDFIVYRLVPPPFHGRKTPDTFVRDIRSFRTRPFIQARRKYCINCHTFSSKSGDDGVVGIQVRYRAKGDYALKVYLGMYDISAGKGWKVRLPFSIQMSTYMAWSPDGERLALSANQQVSALQPMVHETQSVRCPTSDIAIYEPSRNAAYLLPGASEPDILEMYPCWTPEADAVVFSAAPAGEHPAFTHFELFVVPFNNGDGGAPRALPGASENGRSNYYPRFSPGGKWLSFCQSNGGCLIKSSSDLYLMSGDLKGLPHRLACNAPYAADSWHSWSSNGHWLVFATKRDDGIYARLYLTCIDDEGHASPAVRLPLKDMPLASFNIPEFVAHDPPIPERGLYDAIRVERAAIEVEKGR